MSRRTDASLADADATVPEVGADGSVDSDASVPSAETAADEGGWQADDADVLLEADIADHDSPDEDLVPRHETSVAVTDSDALEGGDADAKPPATGDKRCADGQRQIFNGRNWALASCPAYARICEAGECVARGPVMVPIDQQDISRYWIDSTEVTQAQYKAFLDAKGFEKVAPSARCAWNDKYEPIPVVPPSNLPVSGVDFCDAEAFCLWAGKRLCGKVGGGPSSLEDSWLSQWHRACVGDWPSRTTYCFGNTYLSKMCNIPFDPVTKVKDGPGVPVEVGSYEGCSRYGAYDLNGNVWEWEDSCIEDPDDATGKSDRCTTRGGSYDVTQNYFHEWYCNGAYPNSDGTYSHHFSAPRAADRVTIGFRCCADEE